MKLRSDSAAVPRRSPTSWGVVRSLYIQYLIEVNDPVNRAPSGSTFLSSDVAFRPKFGEEKYQGERDTKTPVHADVPASWTPPGGVSRLRYLPASPSGSRVVGRRAQCHATAHRPIEPQQATINATSRTCCYLTDMGYQWMTDERAMSHDETPQVTEDSAASSFVLFPDVEAVPIVDCGLVHRYNMRAEYVTVRFCWSCLRRRPPVLSESSGHNVEQGRSGRDPSRLRSLAMQGARARSGTK